MFITKNKRMLTFLDTQFFLPAVLVNRSIPPRNPKFHVYPRTQSLHTSSPIRETPEIPIPKSPPPVPPITLNVHGITTTRTAKSEAQVALFDYLHCTRGLGFLDAEHISKNSPNFLDFLIEKVGKEKDVSRALSRFFRYHPINEFEPFFESIGLSPSEIGSVLPRGLMFLCDDHALLDNYHALVNYGVPRSNVGRIYREVMRVFVDNENGGLDRKLKEYETLGLSRSTIIKLVTCSPQLLAGGGLNKGFIGVFERLMELGFDGNWIGVCVSCKRTYDWDRILDTLNFLVDIGFDDAELRDLIKNETEVILDGSGKQVYVVAGALLKLGLGMDGVYRFVSRNPQVLLPKCHKNFWKALHFMFEIQMELQDIVNVLCSHIDLLSSHKLKGPKTMLRSFAGDKEKLRRSILDDPSSFFNLALKQKKCSAKFIAARNLNNFVEKTQFLVRIGYTENTDEMVKALKMFRGRGDQLQERFDCLMQAGLDFATVSNMVKLAPSALNQSKDVLEKKIHFLKEYLGYPPEAVAAFPSYLCYDIDRITVRFSMYAWLRERGAAKPMISLSTLLACSDARFVKYFVNIHPEGPDAWTNITSAFSTR